MTIASANQKGGVGKTLLAVCLAEFSAESGKRTLLVDLDSQGNASSRLSGSRADDGYGSSMLYTSGIGDAIVQSGASLWVLRADKNLTDVATLDGRTEDVAMRPRLALAAIAGDYDIIVIDTPPSRGRCLISALVASDHVVTPVCADTNSMLGLADLLADINAVKGGMNPDLNHVGILVNRMRATSSAQTAQLAWLRKNFPDEMLQTTVSERAPAGAAFDERRTVWRSTKGESAMKAGREWRQACAEIFTRAAS